MHEFHLAISRFPIADSLSVDIHWLTAGDLIIILFFALVIDHDKRHEDNRGTNPIREGGILSIDEYLTNKGKGDCQVEPDCDHKGRCQQHCISPRYIGNEGNCHIGLIQKWSACRIITIGVSAYSLV